MCRRWVGVVVALTPPTDEKDKGDCLSLISFFVTCTRSYLSVSVFFSLSLSLFHWHTLPLCHSFSLCVSFFVPLSLCLSLYLSLSFFFFISQNRNYGKAINNKIWYIDRNWREMVIRRSYVKCYSKHIGSNFILVCLRHHMINNYFVLIHLSSCHKKNANRYWEHHRKRSHCL